MTGLVEFISKTIAGYAIKKGLDHLLSEDRESFEKRLSGVIHGTIEEFKDKNLIQDSRDGKFPFYESQVMTNELLMYRFFGNERYPFNNETIKSELRKNPNILPPTEDQLASFFDIFTQNVEKDGELKICKINENYKAENFNISDAISESMNDIFDELRCIHEKINQGGAKQNTPPKELTSLTEVPKEDIVGREDDLKNLRTSILSKKQTLLVNGMGGIGKTTLAAVYVHEYYAEYDHIAWLTLGEGENSLEAAVIANTSLISNLGLRDEPPENQLAACLNKMRNMVSQRHRLLVLDNASDDLARHYDELPKSHGWHLIVTSQNRISERFPVIKLDFLKEDEAMRLFKKFNDAFSDDQVRTIINGVELHTLAIELLAKSSKRNAWNMETVLSAIQRNATSGMDAAHSNNEEIDRIKTYFTRIFDVNHMGAHEIHLLKQFVALPNDWIEDKFLGEILQREKLDWAEEFQSILENLCENGFVMTDAAKWSRKRKMHPVIVEALSPRLGIAAEDIALLMESVTGLLRLDYAKDNPVDKFPFVPFGDSVLRLLPDETSPEMSVLKNNLATVYEHLGRYEKARDLFESALESDIENFGEGHPKVATRQSNLAIVYRKLGEYEKARDFLESALASDIENFGEGHPNVARCQSYLGTVYRELGEYERARDLLESGLASDIKNFGEGHPRVARCQSHLATVYIRLEKYKKARDLLESALKSDIENFGESHPNVAIRQSNLALVYRDLGEHEKARGLLESALASDIENFGERHLNVARCRYNLATVYRNLKDYEKAQELCGKSWDTYVISLGEKHSHSKIMEKDFNIITAKIDNLDGKRNDLPKKMTILPEMSKKEFVGKEADLKKLRDYMLNKNETLLINGMNDIGKTTLVAVYVHEYYDEYDHIAWLTLENNLEKAVSANAQLLSNLNLKDEPPASQLDACLNKLRNMESKKPRLLVLDNANENLVRHYDGLPKSNGWHLIVISRQWISRFNIMKIDFLNEKDAIQLFKKFNKNFSDKDVRIIVNKLELHTPSVESLAKSSRKNGWSMEKIQTSIRRGTVVKNNRLYSVAPIQFSRCFLSHSSKDQEFVNKLHDDLKNKGVKCWYAPKDMKAGQKIYPQIDRALGVSEKLLLVLSEESMQSEWVMAEIRNIRKQEVEQGVTKLFPITITDIEKIKKWECFDTDTGKDLAVEVREYHIPDFSKWSDDKFYQTAFEGLLKDLKK